jgi:tetratricopeptide (TPR) repeat protein
LYSDLLRALQSFHYERTPAMQLRSGLDKVELLHLRGASQDALRLLRRLHKTALANGQTTQLTELIAWERRLLRSLVPEQLRHELDRLDDALDTHQQALGEELKALRVYDRLFALLQVERRMEKRTLRGVVTGLAQELRSMRPHDGWTFNTWSAWLNAHVLIHQMRGEYQKMFDLCTQLLTLWEDHETMRKAEPVRHLRMQAHWLNSALASGNIGKHIVQVRRLRMGPPPSSPEEARLHFQSMNMELLWMMSDQRLPDALKFIPTFEKAMKHLQPLLTEVHHRAFQVNCAEVHFRSGLYEKALKWLKPLGQASNEARDTATFRFTLLLGIVCHLEADNLSLAESQLALLARRLRSEDADWEFGHLAANGLRIIQKEWGTRHAKRLQREFAHSLKDYAQGRNTVSRVADLLVMWCG